MSLRRLSYWTVLVILGALALGGGAAQGTHPGANGVIAFESFGQSPGVTMTINTVNADGTGLTNLLPDSNFVTQDWYAYQGTATMTPTWSPDGTRIAFDSAVEGVDAPSTVCDPQNELIWSVTPLTGAIEGLVCGWETTEQISWSPDGSTLLLDKVTDSHPQSDLWLVDVATDLETRLYQRANDACSWESPDGATWSPLGDRIVFAMTYEYYCPASPNGGGLFTIEPDGSDLTQLTVEPIEFAPGRPDWSPDATKIAYLKPKTATGGYPAVSGDIYVLDVASGTSTLVTSVGMSQRPVWSPDGTKIAFANNRDGDYDIYVMDPDGSDVQQVINLTGDQRSPSWQPITAPPDPDADDDGVDDSIDTGAGAFDDGSGTSGSIVDTAGLAVFVEDDADGVRITVGPGSGKATFTICGFTVKVSAGSEVIVSCASVIVEVVQGSAEVVLGGGNVVIAVPEGGVAEVSEDGGTFFTVENLGSTDVSVTVDGEETTLPAGDTTSVSSDVTDPTVTCNPASFLLNQPGAIVTASVSDGESGPAQSPVGALADTSAPGAHSVNITGADEAGNAKTELCGYTVGYVFQGFFQPIDNLPTVNNAKAGQTIPIKWRLSDFFGIAVSDPASFVSVTSGSTSCEASDPQDAIETYTANSGLQYLGNGNWQLNWKTPKSYAGQCRVMRLNLADGTTDRLAEFKFK
jgi:hypothetical protein